MKQDLILGMDVGGSKIQLVVWDGQEILQRKTVQEPTIEKLKTEILEFNIDKVGLAIPGFLDFQQGKVLQCPNLAEFNGLDLKNFLPNKKILFDNDTKSFLRAEMAMGAGKDFSNTVGVVFGTGIGGGIATIIQMLDVKCQNQMLNVKSKKSEKTQIYRGVNGSAGEVGHMVIEKGKTWEEIYQETKGNDIEQARVNAIGIANLINVLNPEAVIVGGGGLVMPDKNLLQKLIISPLAKSTKIIQSKLSQDAVALGACLLFGD